MTRTIVKRVTAGVAAAAGALVLGITTASATTGAPVETGQAGEVPPCASGQLKLSASEPQQAGASGQHTMTLSLKNISESTCGVDGLPTVELVGPEHDVYGDTFQLPQGTPDGGFAALVPGEASEIAEVTVLSPAQGSETWTPDTIEVTPPGESSPLIQDWPDDLPVLRQDGATHPGSFVRGIA
ncbi:DUF4232 domain-containing protein [Prauserella cavernicola]|uniref:DUF4232 domain-containing protein n=1 Tax=Prauserella cavernicola TaxID=2800127 RepID=A0A934V529_9PSEU|nr:DUF4232 domain-containing protein [Prauserella cavernicola]MBK1786027.1 DUF4232 domain-containing protein [Prauserella cavernicola]